MQGDFNFNEDGLYTVVALYFMGYQLLWFSQVFIAIPQILVPNKKKFNIAWIAKNFITISIHKVTLFDQNTNTKTLSMHISRSICRSKTKSIEKKYFKPKTFEQRSQIQHQEYRAIQVKKPGVLNNFEFKQLEISVIN